MRAKLWGARKARSSERRIERQLVQECELFLAGDYAEYLASQYRAIPNWAWLSLLVHGNREQLSALAKENTGGEECGRRSTVWGQAVAFLAGVLLSQRHDDQDLDELRRSVLVPIELEWLLAGRALRRPEQLVRTVLDALASQQTDDGIAAP
jgi:hypothetical protein